MKQHAPVRRDHASGAVPRRSPLLRLAAVSGIVAFAATLGGCSSIAERMSGTMADLPIVGVPETAPDRPAAPPAYPAVHDLPSPRATTLLNDAEQQRMEDELKAAREQQQQQVTTEAQPELPPPPKPAATAARRGTSSARKRTN